MIKIYFKQVINLLKSNRLLSTITIIGTAIAIAMIMVVTVILRSSYLPFSNEAYRDRMLVVRYGGLQHKVHKEIFNNGSFSYRTCKRCFAKSEKAEAATIVNNSETKLVELPAGKNLSACVRQTDDEFWNVFKFDFLKGKGYDKAQFDAAATKAVITNAIALQLFGTIDVVGKTLLINKSPYTICGVVKSISSLSKLSYAQLWIPISTTPSFTDVWGPHGIMGSCSTYILAKKESDFSAIRSEIEHLTAEFMASYPDYNLYLRGQPDTYFVASNRRYSNMPSQVDEAIKEYIAMFMVLFLVPAINLSSLTYSKMRKRLSEIGVRKAFGASRSHVMMQILLENMFYSILGGILGLFLSGIALFACSEMLFGTALVGLPGVSWWTLAVDLLFDPTIFALAFLFCLILNLLSAAIPAYRVSKVAAVDAINER